MWFRVVGLATCGPRFFFFTLVFLPTATAGSSYAWICLGIFCLFSGIEKQKTNRKWKRENGNVVCGRGVFFLVPTEDFITLFVCMIPLFCSEKKPVLSTKSKTISWIIRSKCHSKIEWFWARLLSVFTIYRRRGTQPPRHRTVNYKITERSPEKNKKRIERYIYMYRMYVHRKPITWYDTWNNREGDVCCAFREQRAHEDVFALIWSRYTAV